MIIIEKLNEKLWKFFKVEHIKMNSQTLENVKKHYSYILFRNGKMYCKFAWYEKWIEVPLIENNEDVKSNYYF